MKWLWCSSLAFFADNSSANLEWYLRHSSAIPPVVVNTSGVNVPCSISVTRVCSITIIAFSGKSEYEMIPEKIVFHGFAQNLRVFMAHEN